MNPPDAPESKAKREESGPKHRTGLVTLLFTDMVGSTALKQQLGDRAGAAFFDKHHRIVREILARFPQGQEMETAGDSFLILFGTPSDAVQFALLLQARLRKLKEDSAVAVGDRIGIHVGEVVIKDNQASTKPKDLYGIQIDTCSRVMSLAQAGQVLMTRSVFDSARQVLKGEDIAGFEELNPEQKAAPLVWLNHGPYLLKGLEEPVEICEVREASQAALSPPTSSDKAQRQVRTDEEQVLGWRPALGQLVPNTRWLLEKKLGEGGFGEVWLGRHQTMKERRVFKFCFRADRVRSLKREMTLFRVLKERVGDHPNIVRLLEVSFEEPPFYVVMDHVEGQDLKAWCEERGGIGSVPLDVKLEIVAQVADALQAAHDAGVIHRDVKPANILVHSSSRREEALTSIGNRQSAIGNQSEPPHVGCYEVQAKLTDFGIGQVVSEEALKGMTRAGFTETIVADSSSSQTGSQMYMAPELLAGKPASTRSDIYSLGVVLYQLLVGDFMRPVTTDWTKDISDPLLRDDLKHCFAGQPEDRFAGVGQLAANLRSLKSRQAALVERERLQRSADRRRAIALSAAGVAGILLLVASALAYGLRRAKVNAEESRQRLVQLSVINGIQRQAEGDLSGALTWAAEAIRLQAGHPGEDLINRIRFGTALRGFPRLLSYWSNTGLAFRACFSTDGRRIFMTESQTTGRVWDIATGKALTTAVTHRDFLGYATFSPDGRLLATTAYDGTARVWDGENGTPVTPELNLNTSSYGGEPGAVFSPDSKLLATRVSTQTAQLWEVSSGQKKGIPMRHGGGLTWMEFNSDGSRLVTAAHDGTAQVWNGKTGEPVTPPLKHDADPDERFVNQARFSPDGRKVASCGYDQTLRLWDAQTGQPLVEPLQYNAVVMQIAFSPDSSFLAAASQDNYINIWRIEGRFKKVASIRAIDEAVGLGPTCQFSPDGRWLLSQSKRNTLRLQIWDVATGYRLLPAWSEAEDIHSATFTPDNQRLATCSSDGYVRLWDLTPCLLPKVSLVHSTNVSYAAYRRDGQRVATIGADMAVRVWNPAAAKEVSAMIPHQAQIQEGDRARFVSFSPDGSRLAGAAGKTAWIWEVESGKAVVVPILQHSNVITSLSFSPDGQKILTTSDDQTARIWDSRTGLPVTPPLPHGDRVWHGAFSPDGKFVATACRDNQARLWDTKSGQPMGRPFVHGSYVLHVAFSNDGRHLLTASSDQTAQVWSMFTRLRIGKPMVHRNIIRDAQFSPDGRRVVTASQDNTARIWDARTGEPLTQPMPHETPLLQAQFSTDGLLVMTRQRFSPGQTIRLWDAQTGLPVAAVSHNAYWLSSHAEFDPRQYELLIACPSLISSGVGSGRATIWDFSPTTWPAKDLARLAEVLSVRRVDPTGTLVPCETPPLVYPPGTPTNLLQFVESIVQPSSARRESRTLKLWQSLRTKYPNEFTAQPDRARQWHELAALESEAAHNWYAVRFHLDVLLRENSSDDGLVRRRAAAQRQLETGQ